MALSACLGAEIPNCRYAGDFLAPQEPHSGNADDTEADDRERAKDGQRNEEDFRVFVHLGVRGREFNFRVGFGILRFGSVRYML